MCNKETIKRLEEEGIDVGDSTPRPDAKFDITVRGNHPNDFRLF